MTPGATFALLPGELRPLSRGEKLGKVALLLGAACGRMRTFEDRLRAEPSLAWRQELLGVYYHRGVPLRSRFHPCTRHTWGRWRRSHPKHRSSPFCSSTQRWDGPCCQPRWTMKAVARNLYPIPCTPMTPFTVHDRCW